MTQYELMVIVDPSLGDKGIQSTLDDLKKVIDSVKGKITKEDIWGEKDLAYKIHGSHKWFYALFDIDIDGPSLKEATNSINLIQGIWRNMFVKKGS